VRRAAPPALRLAGHLRRVIERHLASGDRTGLTLEDALSALRCLTNEIWDRLGNEGKRP